MQKNMLKLVLMLASFSNGMHGSEFAPAEYLTVATFNIDTNIARTEEGYARDSHPQWRVGARTPKIIATLAAIIAQNNPDVIHIQEGRNFTTKFGDVVDSVNPFMEFLATQNYLVATEQYNPSDRAFSFISAIKDTFSIDNYERFYLTKTPNQPTDHSLPLAEIKDNNFGEEWERCVFVTNFHDEKNRKYRAINVHLGVGEFHRKQACRMLQEDAQRISQMDPTILQVQTGDMNTFPDWGGPAQLEIMSKDGVLQEVSQNLHTSNGQAVQTSFISFPFDFAADEARLNNRSKEVDGKPLGVVLSDMNPVDRKAKIEELFATECKALNGQLDRIYQHGFADASAILVPTPQFEDFNTDAFDEASVKEFILRHHHEGPAFASDHQPMIARLQLPEQR